MTHHSSAVLPIYLAVDESGSMSSIVDELDEGLSALHGTLFGAPMAAAKLRLSVLGFADDVTTHVHLADPREIDGLPPLRAQGTTRYGTLFLALASIIPADVAALRGAGHKVHRPTVFFLSDGHPTDTDWPAAHRRLVDRDVHPAAPNIVAFGIGAANPKTVLSVATGPDFAFVAVPGALIATQIAHFCSGLAGSMVRTGRLLTRGRTEFTLERPPGFQLALDVV